MTSWNIVTPQRLISGRGSISFLPNLLAEMGLNKPFVVVDPVVRESNFGRHSINLMSIYDIQLFYDFGTNPTFLQVDEGLNYFNTQRHDCIIAIGGGSAIDLAKVIGLVAANGGKAEEYFRGRKANLRPVPLLAVPTTCGTGAESSPFAVIMDGSIPKKRGIEDVFLMPAAVILDPESLLSLSKTMIAATGIDAFTHIIESHISKKATVLTCIVSRGLLCSVRESLEKSVHNKDLSALEIMQAIAFTARLLYPRTGLSIAHALSHPLGAFTNMHHGIAVAVFFESSMRFNMPACKDVFEDVQTIMGFSACGDSLLGWIDSIVKESGMEEVITRYICEYTDLPIERIGKEALQSSNIPSNPRQIGLDEICEIIEKSLAKFGGQ